MNPTTERFLQYMKYKAACQRLSAPYMSYGEWTEYCFLYGTYLDF